MEPELVNLATQLGDALKAAQQQLVTAESCTGGWLGRVITAVPGSSHWYERGFITYTNVSKQEMLGVAAATLESFGAVSERTVGEMAEGALRHSHGDLSVAISGIAGPGGGSEAKPVGTVCIAWAGGGSKTYVGTWRFEGDREQVRYAAVKTALEGVIERAAGGGG